MLERIIRRLPLIARIPLHFDYKRNIQYLRENEKDDARFKDMLDSLINIREKQNVYVAARASELYKKYMNMNCTRNLVQKINQCTDYHMPSLRQAGQHEFYFHNWIFSHKDVFETICKYDDTLISSCIINAIWDKMDKLEVEKEEEGFSFKNSTFIESTNYLEVLRKEDVEKKLREFEDPVEIEPIVEAFLNHGYEEGFRTSIIFEDYKDEEDYAMVPIVLQLTVSMDLKDDYNRMLYCLKKYVDNHGMDLVQAIYDIRTKRRDADYFEVYRDDVYEEIKESKDRVELFNRILKNDYSSIRKALGDEFSRDEMDYVVKARDFVKQIHKQRLYPESKTIMEGFYSELKRAIDQDGSRVENLKQYCKEVIDKIGQEANELMFNA